MTDDTAPAPEAPTPAPSPVAASADATAEATAPAWLWPMINRTMWRAVFVVLATLAGLWALEQARDLVVVVVVATFLSFAIVPAVDGLVRRLHWSRGLATIVVIAAVFLSVLLLLGGLVPALIDVAGKFGQEVPNWLTAARNSGISLPVLQDSDEQLLKDLQAWLQRNGGTHVLSLAGSGAGLVAKIFLTLIFTIIISAGEPGILRAVLGRLAPANQRRLLDAWETAIAQTGGYFYSRLLLMVFTSTGFAIVMLLVGIPVSFAIPLAIFGAFFVEFIPLVGGYVGMAVPVLFVLVEQGWVRAAVLLAWAVIYAQVHDYVLSPRISSKTMALNSGVALSAALFGAALAGPLGALFAMPVAGMVTAFLGKYLPSNPIVVNSRGLNAADQPDPVG